MFSLVDAIAYPHLCGCGHPSGISVWALPPVPDTACPSHEWARVIPAATWVGNHFLSLEGHVHQLFFVVVFFPIFCSLILKLTFDPDSLSKDVGILRDELMGGMDRVDAASLQGFLTSYAFLADFFGVKYNTEISWVSPGLWCWPRKALHRVLFIPSSTSSLCCSIWRMCTWLMAWGRSN